MFDTMTLNKITAAICCAALVFLLGNFFAEFIYQPHSGHGDHHEQAYKIDTGEDDHSEAKVEEGPSLEELLASADISKGARIFKKCSGCHNVEDGANAAGPHLYGVVSRDIGSVSGYGYSGSLVAVAQVWTPENLNGFLTNPKKWAPGTAMGFSGLSKPQDRANVIAYLDSLDD